MNKNMKKKVILILSLIALFSIVLGGCTIISSVTIPIKGTVYITVDESYRAFVPIGTHYYEIRMDNVFKGTIESSETLVIPNVPAGTHFFEAEEAFSSVYCYGSVTEQISSGTNYITIPVYTY